MVEELQLRPNCRSTSHFVALWKFMARIIPEDTHIIEAYADPLNLASRHLKKKFGMTVVEGDSDGHFLHFRGSLHRLRS